MILIFPILFCINYVILLISTFDISSQFFEICIFYEIIAWAHLTITPNVALKTLQLI